MTVIIKYSNDCPDYHEISKSSTRELAFAEKIY